MAYDFKVVVTSMWRFGARVEWFQQLFQLYGLSLPLDRLDMLPTDDYEDIDGSRSMMVEKYITKHKCENYLCLDDTMEHYDRFLDRVVFTDIDTGFTKEHLRKCYEKMGRI